MTDTIHIKAFDLDSSGTVIVTSTTHPDVIAVIPHGACEGIAATCHELGLGREAFAYEFSKGILTFFMLAVLDNETLPKPEQEVGSLSSHCEVAQSFVDEVMEAAKAINAQHSELAFLSPNDIH